MPMCGWNHAEGQSVESMNREKLHRLLDVLVDGCLKNVQALDRAVTYTGTQNKEYRVQAEGVRRDITNTIRLYASLEHGRTNDLAETRVLAAVEPLKQLQASRTRALPAVGPNGNA